MRHKQRHFTWLLLLCVIAICSVVLYLSRQIYLKRIEQSNTDTDFHTAETPSSATETPRVESDATQPSQTTSISTAELSATSVADSFHDYSSVTEEVPVSPPLDLPEIDLEDPDIAACVNDLLILEQRFTAALAAVESDAKAKYLGLPKAERTRQKRDDILQECIDEVSDMEFSCDAAVEALLSELYRKLTARDIAPYAASYLRDAYYDRKAETKMRYLEKINSLSENETK